MLRPTCIKLCEAVTRWNAVKRSFAAAATQVQSVTEDSRKKEEKLEKATIESSSFVMNMFKGNVKTDQVFPFPEALSQEDKSLLQMSIDPVTKYFEEVNNADKNDEMASVEEHSMTMLREMGAFGMQVPVEYGGMGFKNTQYARLGDIIGRYDLGVGIVLGAHQSIGFKGILLFGNPEQKQRYLPDVATGKKIAAYCLTEPSSGSDAGSIQTKAVPTPDGKHFIMNGSKLWISNGGIADVFTVFAKTPVKTPEGEKMKISAFIVERSFTGVSSGPPEKKMGIKASNTAAVFFDEVKIPAENLLGEVGDGFKIAMNILNNGRFGMAAVMAGTMRMAIEKATDHAVNRTQFGSKISTFGTIEEKLARMSMVHYITESMAYMVSGNMDRGFTDFQLEAAISKVYGSEAAWYVVDEAIQILGGMGFMREPGLERVLRDLRIFRIFEGTNDILRLFVVLTGLQHAGSQLKELQKALKNPTEHLGLIFDEGAKRVMRVVGFSTPPSISQHIHHHLKDSGNLLSKSIEHFGVSVEEVLTRYGKNIIQEQFLLNRLASAAIDIYSMVSVLSRATMSINKKLTSADHEVTMTTIICHEASQRVSQNLGMLKSNEKLEDFKLMSAISQDVCKMGGPIQQNPLGF